MSIEPFKPWLSFSDQVALLESRGMTIGDKAQAEFHLKQIGYYRLSGYSYPFRQHCQDNNRSDDFVEHTQFNDVVALYWFDNSLKLLAMEAIQQIEIAIRSHIAYTLGQHEPLAYLQRCYFNPSFEHEAWLAKYYESLTRSKDDFVLHHLKKYGSLPIWVACELWDFGAMAQLFRGINPDDRNQIAQPYEISGSIFASHLVALNFVRNVAAHHGRLWNRKLINFPTLTGLREPQWHYLDNTKAFTVFCLIQRMLNVICPDNDWGNRFQTLLGTFPSHCADYTANEVSLQAFGLPSELKLNLWSLWNKKTP